MISLHAPIPQTLTFTQTSTWQKSYEATLLAQSYPKRTRCLRGHVLASCNTLGSLLLLLLHSPLLLIDLQSKFPTKYAVYYRFGNCIFSISRRVRKSLISRCPLPAKPRKRSQVPAFNEFRLNLVSLQATWFEPRPIILEAAVYGTIHLHIQLQSLFQSHCHSLKDFVV